MEIGAAARYYASQTKTMLPTKKAVRGQNHLARHSEREKKTRQTEEEVGRQHQGMDRPGVPQVPKGSGKQGKMEETGCKIICGAPTTLAVKGLIMIMIKKCTINFFRCALMYEIERQH